MPPLSGIVVAGKKRRRRSTAAPFTAPKDLWSHSLTSAVTGSNPSSPHHTSAYTNFLSVADRLRLISVVAGRASD
jgi:hypothetical protein